MKVTAKWDKPLKYEYDFKFNELKTTIGSTIEAVFSHTTGTLAASFRVKRSHAGHGVVITSNKPYAAAQEYGARIPARRPVNGLCLAWSSGGGGMVFAKYARAFTLKARPYIEPSVDEWSKNSIGVKWK